MRRKEPTDKEIEDLPDGYIEALERAMIFSAEAKHKLRDDFAKRIMAGMCAGDWKLDLTDGKTWDEKAAKRAYEIADAMLKEREISNV
jgi:hypothetical protein